MLNKLKKIIDVLLEPRILKMLISMHSYGYLKEIGWINSFKNQVPVDGDNNPLPWVTYSFIDFINDRLKKDMDIFEYGSGNSTLWYASKVNSVTSVEHDLVWFEKIQNNMPTNVKIYHQALKYGKEYSKYSKVLNKKYDIVIVDGRDRVNCIKNSIDSIDERGVVVLDDSERESYQEGIDFLIKNNFKKIDFWGISPGLFYKKNTTIFYKENNCLDI